MDLNSLFYPSVSEQSECFQWMKYAHNVILVRFIQIISIRLSFAWFSGLFSAIFITRSMISSRRRGNNGHSSRTRLSRMFLLFNSICFWIGNCNEFNLKISPCYTLNSHYVHTAIQQHWGVWREMEKKLREIIMEATISIQYLHNFDYTQFNGVFETQIEAILCIKLNFFSD